MYVNKLDAMIIPEMFMNHNMQCANVRSPLLCAAIGGISIVCPVYWLLNFASNSFSASIIFFANIISMQCDTILNVHFNMKHFSFFLSFFFRVVLVVFFIMKEEKNVLMIVSAWIVFVGNNKPEYKSQFFLRYLQEYLKYCIKGTVYLGGSNIIFSVECVVLRVNSCN